MRLHMAPQAANADLGLNLQGPQQ